MNDACQCDVAAGDSFSRKHRLTWVNGAMSNQCFVHVLSDDNLRIIRTGCQPTIGQLGFGGAIFLNLLSDGF